MHISEAAKLAAEQGRLMVRKSVISRSDTVFGAVQPTNSYERCKLIVFKEDETRSCRCWNPTQADLVADDCELLGNELLKESDSGEIKEKVEKEFSNRLRGYATPSQHVQPIIDVIETLTDRGLSVELAQAVLNDAAKIITLITNV